MREKVIEHIERLFQAHQELAEFLPEVAFGQKLSIPSNTLGGQYWCLIGARESYTNAVKENGWAGFGCSMTSEDSSNQQKVIQTLNQTTQKFAETVSGIEWTNEREGLLIDLLEHETQHQGQFIRYVYGLKYEFPMSWTKRWSLS